MLELLTLLVFLIGVASGLATATRFALPRLEPRFDPGATGNGGCMQFVALKGSLHRTTIAARECSRSARTAAAIWIAALLAAAAWSVGRDWAAPQLGVIWWASSSALLLAAGAAGHSLSCGAMALRGLLQERAVRSRLDDIEAAVSIGDESLRIWNSVARTRLSLNASQSE